MTIVGKCVLKFSSKAKVLRGGETLILVGKQKPSSHGLDFEGYIYNTLTKVIFILEG